MACATEEAQAAGHGCWQIWAVEVFDSSEACSSQQSGHHDKLSGLYHCFVNRPHHGAPMLTEGLLWRTVMCCQQQLQCDPLAQCGIVWLHSETFANQAGCALQSCWLCTAVALSALSQRCPGLPSTM